MRDIHMIYWVAKRYFRVNSINELVQRNFLTTEEYVEIEAANKYLNRIRFALHICVADVKIACNLIINTNCGNLGYRQSERMAVEAFMSGYYRNVQSVVKLNEILLQHFREELFENFSDDIKPINNRFCIVNDYLDITHPDVFEINPTALLEVFVALANFRT
ncbi:hypothetical protein THIOSC15_2860007 [uncultured Thiomicrorhabdus sp.]